MSNVLGLSAYFHDSAAALVRDGRLVAAAQEERFSRRKHDARYPEAAIRYCLEQAGLSLGDLDAVVFYEKPLLKFARLLETYLAHTPRGFATFRIALPVWVKDKLYLKRNLRQNLAALQPGAEVPPLLFSEHHQAHAASAFYPSPFEEAAILCLDGVGEWATASAWMGRQNRIEPLWELRFPDSLGLLYSAFTYYAGFRVNSGEGTLMGLAPYGTPRYAGLIRDRLVNIKADGSFRLNHDCFDFAVGTRMTSEAFHRLFGRPPRRPGEAVERFHADLAASIQAVTEDIVLRLAASLYRASACPRLCLAGGVALNCVANGRLRAEGPFESVWVQPAAGDAGAAVGAALLGAHLHFDESRLVDSPDAMAGAVLGPAFEEAAIAACLRRRGAKWRQLDEAALNAEIADRLAAGQVIGWFQGRMEFGPRALGHRSILADPRAAHMQARINDRVKFREPFRPFAPAVLAESAGEFFPGVQPSPYMQFTLTLEPGAKVPADAAAGPILVTDGGDFRLPAVTHVDGSARVQTVEHGRHPRLHALLRAFEERTGCPVLLNTSFNAGGAPIVCAPDDAYDCFLRTDLDCLVMGSFLVSKDGLPAAARRAQSPGPARAGVPVPGRLAAGLARTAAWLQRCNTWVWLAACFFGLMVPAGLLLRLTRQVRPSPGFDARSASYLVPVSGRCRAEDLHKPF